MTLNDVAVSSSQVKEALRQYESVDRCEASGEILNGSNTYVFVDYDQRAIKKLSEVVYSEVEDYLVNGFENQKNDLYLKTESISEHLEVEEEYKNTSFDALRLAVRSVLQTLGVQH